EPDDVAALDVGGDEQQVVTVRVEPVAQHVVADGLAGLYGDGALAEHDGRFVDVEGADRHVDRRLVHAAGAAVAHGVAERRGPRRVLRRGELERSAAVDVLDGARRRGDLGGVDDGQDV